MRSLASAFLIISLLVAAAPAAADWSAPRELSHNGTGGVEPMLLFDGKAHGLAAWRTLKGKRVAPLTGTDKAANGALNVQPGQSGAYGNGRLLTLEQTADHPNRNPPGNRLYLRDGTFKGSLGKRVLLTATGRIDDRWIAVAPNGDALIVWSSFGKTGTRAHSVYAVERRGGKLSKPKRLASRGAIEVTAAFAGKTELVAWRHGGALDARYRRGGAWSKAVRLSPGGTGVAPSVAATAGGRLLVAARSSDVVCDEGDCGEGGTAVVERAYGSVRRGFRPVARLDSYHTSGSDRFQSGPVLAGFDDRGHPHVAWSAPDGAGDFRVHVDSRGKALSPAGVDSPVEGFAAGHGVTVAWTNLPDRQLWAARDGSAPEQVSATSIQGPTTNGADVQLAYPPGKDEPVALWTDSTFAIMTATGR